MSECADRLLWLDVETTGLNPWTGDQLLQVACLVTDTALVELDDPREWVVRHDADAVAAMMASTTGYVVDMHRRTGLWDRLPSGTPLKTVEADLMGLLDAHTSGRRQARLAGNSVKLDFDFTARFLPAVADRLHYRVVDVSGVDFVADRLGWVGAGGFVKRATHNAVDDIRESLEQLRWIDRRVRESQGRAGVDAQVME